MKIGSSFNGMFCFIQKVKNAQLAVEVILNKSRKNSAFFYKDRCFSKLFF